MSRDHSIRDKENDSERFWHHPELHVKHSKSGERQQANHREQLVAQLHSAARIQWVGLRLGKSGADAATQRCGLLTAIQTVICGARMPRLIGLFAAVGLAHSAAGAPVRTHSSHAKPVWLVSNGFHTAVVIRSRDAPSRWRRANGNAATHVLFGWGDATFYRASRITVGMACKAAFSINPSAIHVMPFKGSVGSRFAHSDVIRLGVSPSGFARLRGLLERAFVRGPGDQFVVLGPGPSRHSRFYAGRERFYFPKVCNVWTARALREAGVPIFVPTAITAGDLVWQAEKIGHREQWKRLPLDGF